MKSGFFDRGDTTALGVGEAVGWTIGLTFLAAITYKLIVRWYRRIMEAKARRRAVAAIAKTTVAAIMDEDCAICLGPYLHEEEVGQLRCAHSFHYACAAQWVGRQNAICPVCRAAVVEPPLN